MLADRFGVEHSTLQVEHEQNADELLQIDPGAGVSPPRRSGDQPSR
jgi:hypothetical protein